VDRESWPSTYDRELDFPIRQPVRIGEPFHPYRRLFVNPFLAVASCVAAILLLRVSLEWRSLAVFVASLGLVGVSPLFTRIHCLDCGRTTGIFASRRHACEPALARWRRRQPGRWPFPAPKTQAVLWVHVLTSIAALVLILLLSRR